MFTVVVMVCLQSAVCDTVVDTVVATVCLQSAVCDTVVNIVVATVCLQSAVYSGSDGVFTVCCL